MKVELPALRRCCCCIPLRYGLLAAGYLKMVFTLILLGLTITGFVIITHNSHIKVEEVIILSIGSILCLVDIPMTITFLVGGHQKCPKKLRVSYIYNMVLTSIFTLIVVGCTIYTLYMYNLGLHLYFNGYEQAIIVTDFLITQFITGIAYIGSQVYFVLLIRSEITKLNNTGKFRFTNAAAEAHCTLDNDTAPRRSKHAEQQDHETY